MHRVPLIWRVFELGVSKGSAIPMHVKYSLVTHSSTMEL